MLPPIVFFPGHPGGEPSEPRSAEVREEENPERAEPGEQAGVRVVEPELADRECARHDDGSPDRAAQCESVGIRDAQERHACSFPGRPPRVIDICRRRGHGLS